MSKEIADYARTKVELIGGQTESFGCRGFSADDDTYFFGVVRGQRVVYMRLAKSCVKSVEFGEW